jgi:hypothetical protein
MMAPHFERARMLQIAIEAACHELDEPIDRIEVTGRRVLVWAGAKQVALSYSYANAYDRAGIPMPGSGNWVVEKAGSTEDPRGWLIRLLRLARTA